MPGLPVTPVWTVNSSQQLCGFPFLSCPSAWTRASSSPWTAQGPWLRSKPRASTKGKATPRVPSATAILRQALFSCRDNRGKCGYSGSLSEQGNEVTSPAALWTVASQANWLTHIPRHGWGLARPWRAGDALCTKWTGSDQLQDILTSCPPLQGRKSYRTLVGYNHFRYIYGVTGPWQTVWWVGSQVTGMGRCSSFSLCLNQQGHREPSSGLCLSCWGAG